jgi:hypothetical protein
MLVFSVNYWFEKLNKLELHEMHSQHIDPIEDFPNKIDQLFDALNRVYLF